MSDPRYSQGSSGDCFLGLPAALVLSVVLHVLLLGFADRPPLPVQADGGTRVLAMIGDAKRYSPQRLSIAPGKTDRQPADVAPRDSIPEASALRGPEDRKNVSPALASGTDDDVQPIPPGMDLSAYRLALGRAFGNLLDEDIKGALPAGELTFGIYYRASGSPPSLRLLGVADQVLSDRLLVLMAQALALTPLPANWQARDYRLELRAVVVGV